MRGSGKKNNYYKALVLPFFIFSGLARADIVGRWAQSTALISPNTSPSLLVISGKSYVAGQTVNSNPTTSTSYSLSLTSPILDLTSPPWISLSAIGPSTSYGAALSISDSIVLLFGGDASGSNIALQNAADSSWLLSNPLSSSASWIHEPTGWSNQPTRRQNFYSSSSTTGSTSRVWIFGGISSDGSLAVNSELWTLEMGSDASISAGQGWFQISGSGGPPAMYDGVSVLLLSSTGVTSIVFLGGIQVVSGVSSMVSLSSIWIFTPSTSTWNQINVANTPITRRGHVAVAISDSKIWIQGGRSLDGTSVYSDSAVLDLNAKTWTTTSNAGNQVWGHSAVLVGTTIISSFGYGLNQPVSASLVVYSPSNDTYLTYYQPSYAPIILPILSSTSTSSTSSTSSSTHSSSSTSQTSTSTTSQPPIISPTSSPDISPHSNISTGVLAASSVIGILIALILLIGGTMFYKKRQRLAISRAFPSPRSGNGWHSYGAEGSGSLIGDNWNERDGEYMVEKTAPIGSRNDSIFGRIWRGSSKKKNDNRKGGVSNRFDMLRDEESDKWDSLRGQEGWKTFNDGEGEEDGYANDHDMSNSSMWDQLRQDQNEQSYHSQPRHQDLAEVDRNGDIMLTPIQEYDEEFEDSPYRSSNTGMTSSSNDHTTSSGVQSYESTNPSNNKSNFAFGSALEPTISRGQSLYGAGFSNHTVNTNSVQLAPRTSLSSNDHGEVSIVRSSTWWSRLNNITSTTKNNPLTHSTSSNRIRDPATLIPIVYFQPDELGRLDEKTRNLRKESSISSNISTNTASSSLLEKRMRDMVVVERLRTGSGSTASFSPTLDSDLGGYEFGNLPSKSLDDHPSELKSGVEDEEEDQIVWNGLLERGSGNNISPSKQLRNPFDDPTESISTTPKALRGPRPESNQLISPIKPKPSGVKAMIQQLEGNSTTSSNESVGNKSKVKKSKESSSPRIGHALAKREELYVANPDDE